MTAARRIRVDRPAPPRPRAARDPSNHRPDTTPAAYPSPPEGEHP